MPRIQTQNIPHSRDKKLVITFDTPENRNSFLAILTREAHRKFPESSGARNEYDRLITAGTSFDTNQLHINPSLGRDTMGTYNDRRIGGQGVAIQFKEDEVAHIFITTLGLKHLFHDPDQQAFVISGSGAVYFRQRVLSYHRGNLFDTGLLPDHVVAVVPAAAAVADVAEVKIKAAGDRFIKDFTEALEDEVTLETVSEPVIHDGITFSRSILDSVRHNPKTKKEITPTDPVIKNDAIHDVLVLLKRNLEIPQLYHELLDLLITILQRRSPDRQFKDLMLGNVVQVVFAGRELRAGDERINRLVELTAIDPELQKQQDPVVIHAIRAEKAAADGARCAEGDRGLDRGERMHADRFFPHFLGAGGAAAAAQDQKPLPDDGAARFSPS